MKRLGLLMLIFLMTIGLGLSAHAQDGGDLPSLDELEVGVWTTLSPGGDTMCALGTPYSFHVRPAESDKLLVFFNGGGACWFGAICDPMLQPTYVPLAELEHNNPAANPAGIFDFDNPENPFADYNMVFVSYCTGDVHLGDATVTYEVPAMEGVDAHEVTIHHNGFNNSMSALMWVVDNYESLDTIFVTGSSAGSIASPFYAALLADAYPDSAIIQLGDGAGGYRSAGIPSILETWGFLDLVAALDDELEVNSLEDLYVLTGESYPDVVMSQYNTAEDVTQYGFLALLGITDMPLSELLALNIGDIEDALGYDLPHFLAGGDLHTILRLNETYTYAADGVRFLDWLTALANGEAVGDVTCVDCSVPEVVEAAN